MEPQLIQLRPRELLSGNTSRLYDQLKSLVAELQTRALPSGLVSRINAELEAVNAEPDASGSLKTVLGVRQKAILKLVEKEVKLVPRNHYRSYWMILGMSLYGLPIGSMIGLLSKNMGLLGIGLPIGMGFGAMVGTGMDQKALREGRQLNIEIKS